jgi:hypothetical protein
MSDTTEDLIQRVKNLETIPDSGAAYSDEVLLEYLDQSLKGFIVPALEATLEEHFVVTRDFQMPGQQPYSGNSPPENVPNTVNIPGESTGLRLRDVYIIGSDGSPYNLPRLTPTQAAAQSFGTPWGVGVPPLNNNQFIGGFFLQGNTLQIYPYGLASNKIVRITYQRAPADLCLTSAAGRVTAVTGNVVTVDKVLGWQGVNQVGPVHATRVNVVSGAAPHDYVPDPRAETRVYTTPTPLDDVQLVNVAGNVLTFPAGVTDNIVPGDWVNLRGQSVFAQNIPRELLPALCRKAAEMCLEAAGDREGQMVAQTTYNQMIKMALSMIAPRVIGKPTKVLPTNSAFKASRGSNFGRW